MTASSLTDLKRENQQLTEPEVFLKIWAPQYEFAFFDSFSFYHCYTLNISNGFTIIIVDLFSLKKYAWKICMENARV